MGWVVMKDVRGRSKKMKNKKNGENGCEGGRYSEPKVRG